MAGKIKGQKQIARRGRGLEQNIIVDLTEMGFENVDSCGSMWRRVARSSKHSNEPSCPIKDDDAEQLNNYQFPERTMLHVINWFTDETRGVILF
jgi:hypothetical protein